MITPIAPLVISSSVKTYDGIWIRNVQINAPSPTKPVRANITISPFNSTTGELSDNIKMIQIQDVYAAAASSSYVANAMGSIFGYVQEQVISQSLF